MALRTFILEEKNSISVWASTDITRWDPLIWPSKHIYSNPGCKYEFSLKVTLAQSKQTAKFQSKKKYIYIYILDYWEGHSLSYEIGLSD